MLGHASLSTSSRFALSSGRKNVEPVTLASGLARFDTRPVATASPLMAITIGMVEVACLAARVPGVPWVMRRSNSCSNKLSHQLREPIVPFFRPAKLDNNVPSLNVAEFTKARPEHVYRFCRARGARRAKKSDPRHPAGRLLRPRNYRPRSPHASEKRDELAPLHVHPPCSGDDIILAQISHLVGAETGIETIAAAHSKCRLRVKSGKPQYEHMSSVVHPTTDIPANGSFAPTQDIQPTQSCNFPRRVRPTEG